MTCCAICLARGELRPVTKRPWLGAPICDAHLDACTRSAEAQLAEHSGAASLSSLAEFHRPADATVH